MRATIRLLGPGVAWEIANRSVNWAAVTQCCTSTAWRDISGRTLFLPPIESIDSMLKKAMSERWPRVLTGGLFAVRRGAGPPEGPARENERHSLADRVLQHA